MKRPVWLLLLSLICGACATEAPEDLASPQAQSESVGGEEAVAGFPAGIAAPPPERNPFGLNSHLAPFDSMQWDRIAWLGVGWVRVDLYWWVASRGPGVYEWSRIDGTVMAALERNIEVVGLMSGTPPWVLGYPQEGAWAANMVPPSAEAWTDFVREAVRRYRPGGVLAQQEGWPAERGIRHWEVWNEPDLTNFWRGTAAQYRDLIWLPGARVIRQEAPTAKILFGGLCCFDTGRTDPWKQGGSTAEVLASQESRALMDIFSVHYYPRSVEQTALEDPYREMENWLRGVQGFLDQLYGTSKVVPIWLTETGFPANVFGEALQDVGVRRLVGRMLLSNTNRLVRPQTGLYLLEKFFLFNSISDGYGVFNIDPLLRTRPSGDGYRISVFRAFESLEGP